MSEALGQQLTIDIKPGAGTLIGATVAAKSPADGYTLLVGGLASNAVSPLLFKADFDPIKDVVDAVKNKPSKVMYGSSGNVC